MGVQQHRDQHNEIAEQDRGDRLPPVHPARDQTAGKHVGGNAHAHADPKRQIAVDAPGTVLRTNGRKVLIVQIRIVLHATALRTAPRLTSSRRRNSSTSDLEMLSGGVMRSTLPYM